MNDVLNRLRHAAAGGKAHAGRGRLMVRGTVLHLFKVNILRLKHPAQLFKRQNEVHLAADAAAAGLELLRGARADECDAAAGVAALDETRRQHHRGHRHRDVGREAGELRLGHHGPRRAAGCTHKRLLFRNGLQEFLRLLDGTEIGADGDLLDAAEAEHLHRGLELTGGHLVAELTPEGRGDDGDDLVAALDGVDHLEHLALVDDGAERAVDKAHAAADALVVVDLRAAVLVAADGIHAAGLLAGAGKADDRTIGAGVLALAALDALRLVDLGLPVVERDGAAGAVIGTVLGQTALTGVRHLKMSRRTAVAGILDDVDQRRIVVFLRDRTLLHSVGEQVVLRNVAQGQAHSQTDPFANDGALQEDRLPELPNLSGHDLIGQLLHPAVVIPILIGKSCHLGKDPLANVGYAALDVAHDFFSS